MVWIFSQLRFKKGAKSMHRPFPILAKPCKFNCGVWKMRGVENEERGKCRKLQFQYEISKYIYILIERVFYNIVTLAC